MLHRALRYLLALPLLAPAAPADPGPGGAPPPRFVANAGQWEGPARFRIGHGALNGWVLDDGFVIDLWRDGRGCALGFALEGARAVVPRGIEECGAPRHYLGAGGAAHTGVRSFAAVRYAELRPGLDLVLREGAGLFEYDLELAAGVELAGLALRVEGARALAVGADGALLIETALGELRQSAPVAWTRATDGTRAPVACAFRILDEARFGFCAPGRAADEALVIDPGIEWGSYVGDFEDDVALDLVLAPNGEAVVVGTTLSPFFPATRDAHDLVLDGASDAFVARFTAEGDELVFATYLGGSAGELAYAVALGAGGELVVAGETHSGDFPVTPGAYDTSHNGGADAFVAVLSGDGEQLLRATFLGAGQGERAYDLAFDAVAGATLCGQTSSAQFPTTPNAFDTSYGGSGDAFVARLSPDLASLARSTFLGADGADTALCLSLAADGGPVVAGVTGSAGFPTTPGAFDRTANGSGVFQDGFVTRLAPGFGALSWSTFLGGAGNDVVFGIDLRADGAAAVAGGTASADFPTTANAHDPTYGGAEDAFVSVLDPAGAALELSTFLGGGDLDRAQDVALAPGGALLVTGGTRSPDFAVTPWAVDPSFNSPPGSFLGDVFVVELAAGGALEYGTFIGGGQDEEGTALDLLPDGRAVVCGRTSSHGFPTPGGFDTVYDFSGQPDGFVFRLERSRFPFAYGDPGPSSAGYPPAVGADFASLAAGSHGVWIDLAPPNVSGWLFHGSAAAALPFGDHTLLVAPPFVRYAPVSLDYFGSETVAVAIEPWMVGTTRYWQFWFLDPGAPTGVGLSPGLEVTYYP